MVNPQTTSAVPQEWHVQSYEDLQPGAEMRALRNRERAVCKAT